MPAIGQQIGEYTIEAEIGSGGMAQVYRARHGILDTLHALNVLDPKYRAEPEVRKRFLDEAKIQAKHLKHPNIVRVTNIVANTEVAGLVMDHELSTHPDARMGTLAYLRAPSVGRRRGGSDQARRRGSGSACDGHGDQHGARGP